MKCYTCENVKDVEPISYAKKRFCSDNCLVDYKSRQANLSLLKKVWNMAMTAIVRICEVGIKGIEKVERR